MTVALRGSITAFALLAAAGGLNAAEPTFTILHSFQYAADGAYPEAGLVLDSSGELYGTASYYGPDQKNGSGTVFKIRSDGTGFAAIHAFMGTDGRYSLAGLVLDSSGYLYGTTDRDAGSGCQGDTCGKVFKVKADGTGFVLVHSFSGTDGNSPTSRLLLDSGGNLYGTTSGGGAGGYGTIFKVRTDGTEFTTLHSFSKTDGSIPVAGLILDGGELYGTASEGGTTGKCFQSGLGPTKSDVGCGVVFKVRTDGTDFSVVHAFSGLDGATPKSDLILDGGGFLYGTTNDASVTGDCVQGPAAAGCGTIFKVMTDGTEFSNLHAFSKSAADGALPIAGLTFGAGSLLYGTTESGGASEDGTVFSIDEDGTGFTLLHSFTGATTDARSPAGDLILDAHGNLYGTTSGGGASAAGFGTIFKLALGTASGAPGRASELPVTILSPIRTGGRRH